MTVHAAVIGNPDRVFGYYVVRWIRPQANGNATLAPEGAETLDPVFLDMLGFFSGNVETLLPR